MVFYLIYSSVILIIKNTLGDVQVLGTIKEVVPNIVGGVGTGRAEIKLVSSLFVKLIRISAFDISASFKISLSIPVSYTHLTLPTKA